jgi:hypothetical protein
LIAVQKNKSLGNSQGFCRLELLRESACAGGTGSAGGTGRGGGSGAVAGSCGSDRSYHRNPNRNRPDPDATSGSATGSPCTCTALTPAPCRLAKGLARYEKRSNNYRQIFLHLELPV